QLTIAGAPRGFDGRGAGALLLRAPAAKREVPIGRVAERVGTEELVFDTLRDTNRLCQRRAPALAIDPGERTAEIEERLRLAIDAAGATRERDDRVEIGGRAAHVPHRSPDEPQLLAHVELERPSRFRRHLREQIARPRQRLDSLAIRTAPHRVVRDPSQVSNGAQGIAAALEVQDELRRALHHAIGELLFEADAEAPMEPHAMRARDLLVEHRLVESVAKGVARIDDPVGPARSFASLEEPAAPDEIVAPPLDLDGIRFDRRGDDTRRELDSRHAGRGEKLAVAGVEPLVVALDHLADGGGDAALELRRLAPQPKGALANLEDPAPDRIVDEAHHEERMAVGPAMNDRRELGRRRLGRGQAS